MRTRMLLVVLALATSCSSPVLPPADSDPSQASPGDHKVKVKGDMTIARDKSKPVRKGIEEWYARNAEAFRAKDVEAVMALRAEDFHTILPDGTVNTRADMEAYTQRLVGMIDHFITLDFQIGTIEVKDDLASADVTQTTVRMQRFPDGTLHKVEAGVVQRETLRTDAGWLMHRVDNIQEGYLLVDDELFTAGP